MALAFIADTNLEAAEHAAHAYGGPTQVLTGRDRASQSSVAVSRTLQPLFDHPELGVDVLVEATNTVGFAAGACLDAIDAGMHVVLMNAEVDLAVGSLLRRKARERGLVVTSDAGDQHGVLMRMIDEIEMWGFRVVMAGNVKGFLNRYATAESLAHEARIRKLNPVQCCAYTDGTKLGVEMALVANATGLVPWVPGMEGPRAEHVREVFHLFDFDKYGNDGVVDYVLGAQPGGGVFVVGKCDDPMQTEYLRYYKMGDGPYYLFYRPYHLCHLETPRAIALAAIFGSSVLEPSYGRVADVFAHAKRDLRAGETIGHGIGGDAFYGVIDRCRDADARGEVPIALLDADGEKRPRLLVPLERDAPLRWGDIELPESDLLSMHRQQAAEPAPV
jgi:predicted homoserine dehydrogenase-like protein